MHPPGIVAPRSNMAAAERIMTPMVDPAHSPVSSSPHEARTDPEATPLDPADFPGCRAIHIPRSEIEDYEGRLEYWEARTETAMVVCEPTTRFHEQPSHQLAGRHG